MLDVLRHSVELVEDYTSIGKGQDGWREAEQFYTAKFYTATAAI